MNAGRSRFRILGGEVGQLVPGKLNAITDVEGVKVAHKTIIKGEGPLEPGKGPIRTGVTVILPHENNPYRNKVRASAFVINGYGKTIGLVQLRELGFIESHIALTNTLNVPLVANGLIDYHLQENPDIGISTSSINTIVAECNDGYLNDLQGRHVKEKHVLAAIQQASKKVDEGNVGAGTGMIAFGYKAGIGTASRVIPTDSEDITLGTLVLANFGAKKDLTILGARVHSQESQQLNKKRDGSIIVIIATNAPLTSRQLHRLAKRAPFGIAKTGGFASHGSGDIVITFSTANKIDHDSKKLASEITTMNDSHPHFTSLLRAVVETTEEAILNSLCMATTMEGRDKHVIDAIGLEKIKEHIKKEKNKR